MANQNDEAVDKLVAAAVRYSDGTSTRRAARLLIDAFRHIVMASSESDRIWGSEVGGNLACDVYPYADGYGEGDDEIESVH
jgi:hypothetical protein